MPIQLTKGQEAAVAMARSMAEWRGRPFLGVLVGAAGTGKTTVLRQIAEECGYPVCVAPTGKAAVRISQATELSARTIHSWLYTAREDPNTGEPIYDRKAPGELDAGEPGFVVVDESSMVGEDLWEDLYDACCLIKRNVLIVGDYAQLPPVQKSEREFNLLSPEFSYDARTELAEVMRQALDSPVLRAATRVRLGDPIGGVLSLPRVAPKDLVKEAARIVSAGGAVLCHKNETRHRLNAAIRRELGRLRGIVPGEPLLVLENNHRLDCFNGETGPLLSWVQEPGEPHGIKDYFRKLEGESRFGLAKVDFGRGKQPVAAVAEAEILGLLDKLARPAIGKAARIVCRGDMDPDDGVKDPPVLHANLGYALTAHKAQGSEWPEILLVVEPSSRLGTKDGTRLAYTAITRASKKASVCLGGPPCP